MDQPEKEVKFQVGENELKGKDNPAMDLNESEEHVEIKTNGAPNGEPPPSMADIVLEEEPTPAIRDKLEGEEKYVALRPPLHTFPSCTDDQKLREAARAVLDERYRPWSIARWKRRGIRKYYKQQVSRNESFEVQFPFVNFNI